MGYERLKTWGYPPQEIPLGSYIYDSARGQDPVIRLGMLHYFETKNIGKKTKRAEAFATYDDKLSQHDMDFDWADETIHAAYGHRWLDALRALRPDAVPDIDTIRQQCDVPGSCGGSNRHAGGSQRDLRSRSRPCSAKVEK